MWVDCGGTTQENAVPQDGGHRTITALGYRDKRSETELWGEGSMVRALT